MAFEDALPVLPSLGQPYARLPRRGPSRASVRRNVAVLHGDRSDQYFLTGLTAPRRRRCKEPLLASRDLARSYVDQKRRQQKLPISVLFKLKLLGDPGYPMSCHGIMTFKCIFRKDTQQESYLFLSL